ncbi:MAG TPA: hypothetical protein VFY53_05600 [Rhodoplanes sp.]|nr:hypothetical protein [Rhodoplanes sp.]
MVAPPPPELAPVCAAPDWFDAVDGLLADRPGTAVVMSGVPRPLSEGTLVVAPLMLLPTQGWADSAPGAGPPLDVLGLAFAPGLFKPAPGCYRARRHLNAAIAERAGAAELTGISDRAGRAKRARIAERTAGIDTRTSCSSRASCRAATRSATAASATAALGDCERNGARHAQRGQQRHVNAPRSHHELLPQSVIGDA